MKKSLVAGLVVAVAAQLAGCGYTPEQRATSGAIVGANTVVPATAATRAAVTALRPLGL